MFIVKNCKKADTLLDIDFVFIYCSLALFIASVIPLDVTDAPETLSTSNLPLFCIPFLILLIALPPISVVSLGPEISRSFTIPFLTVNVTSISPPKPFALPLYEPSLSLVFISLATKFASSVCAVIVL